MVDQATVESLKYMGDGLSVAGVLATLAAWLPPAAALVSLIWGLIRIYETKTVQQWLKSRKKPKRRARRVKVSEQTETEKESE